MIRTKSFHALGLSELLLKKTLSNSPPSHITLLFSFHLDITMAVTAGELNQASLEPGHEGKQMCPHLLGRVSWKGNLCQNLCWPILAVTAACTHTSLPGGCPQETLAFCSKCDLVWDIQRDIWMYLFWWILLNYVGVSPLLGNGGHFLRLSFSNSSISGKGFTLENICPGMRWSSKINCS